MKVLPVVVLLLATASTATAQATKPLLSEAMQALNFLVGKWQGIVKYEPGSSTYPEASWTANVHYNVGGSILIIDERGSELVNNNKTTVEVLVLVYWDSAAKEYPAKLYWSSKGVTGSVDAKGYVQDNIFILKTNDSRFTVRLNEKGQ